MSSPDCDSFGKYEDYLDSKINKDDLFYLGSIEVARRKIEFGRPRDAVLTREEFAENERIAAENALASKEMQIPRLASAGCSFTAQQPLLQALAEREDAVRDGRLQTVIFVRTANAEGQEVSGYIDFGHRLAGGEMEAVFSGSRRLLPNGADLSYHNWATQASRTNATEGFEAVCDVDTGIMVLRSKHDGIAIDVDPACAAGDKSTCMHLEAPQYQQVILFDHIPSPP